MTKLSNKYGQILSIYIYAVESRKTRTQLLRQTEKVRSLSLDNTATCDTLRTISSSEGTPPGASLLHSIDDTKDQDNNDSQSNRHDSLQSKGSSVVLSTSVQSTEDQPRFVGIMSESSGGDQEDILEEPMLKSNSLCDSNTQVEDEGTATVESALLHSLSTPVSERVANRMLVYDISTFHKSVTKFTPLFANFNLCWS